LKDRGRIAQGAFADVVVFDESTFADRSTYEQPTLLAVGVRYLLVNGTPAIDGGTFANVFFDSDPAKLERFVELIKDEIPENTGVVIRGSAVTGHRWKDKAPFDCEGPGTSDLDVTLVGNRILDYFTLDGFFVPGVHSRPLSDVDRDIADLGARERQETKRARTEAHLAARERRNPSLHRALDGGAVHEERQRGDGGDGEHRDDRGRDRQTLPPGHAASAGSAAAR